MTLWPGFAAMQSAVEFNPELHAYRVGGRSVPSVTQILKIVENFDGIPVQYMESARLRGEYIHKAVALLIRDDLDKDSVPEEYRLAIHGMENFIKHSGVVPISSETPVCHSLGYAGTYDMTGYFTDYSLFEFKAGADVPKTAGPQTMAYAKAIESTIGEKIRHRYCIHLHSKYKAGYKAVKLKDDNADWNLFVSALNCWRFKYG